MPDAKPDTGARHSTDPRSPRTRYESASYESDAAGGGHRACESCVTSSSEVVQARTRRHSIVLEEVAEQAPRCGSERSRLVGNDLCDRDLA
jgi:hypothetical protein